jgi:hypothetical protein
MFESLATAIKELREVEPCALGDGESIKELHRLATSLDAVLTRATAAFEASHEYAQDGARSAAKWIAVTCNEPVATAKRRLALGRALRTMPVTEEAWLDGEISGAHVGALARARTPKSTEVFARDEELLIGQARQYRFGRFMAALNYWRMRADPDDAERDAEEQHNDRDVTLAQSYQGMWLGQITLDPISGAIVSGELRRLDEEFFEADWAEARARIGEGVCVQGLARTNAQRRADALVEMATRSRAMPEGARRPEPLFSVLVGYETLAGPICELANGAVVAPGQLVRWLDTAWVERVVFDGPSRVIDVGEHRRLFKGATRRAVQVRDKECFHEFCDLPAADCQIDHVIPYAAGGPTVQDNGRVACGAHNRDRHKRKQ